MLAVLLVVFCSGDVVGSGIASMYRPWVVSKTVPYGRYPADWSSPPTASDLVCAHRTLPFGSLLRLSTGKATAYCVVMDRGPYGFCAEGDNGHRDRRCKKGYRYIVRKGGPKQIRRWKARGLRGYYRGIVDATPAVHRMLGGKGWVFVKVRRLAVPAFRRALKLRETGTSSVLYWGSNQIRVKCLTRSGYVTPTLPQSSDISTAQVTIGAY